MRVERRENFNEIGNKKILTLTEASLSRMYLPQSPNLVALLLAVHDKLTPMSSLELTRW